MTQQNENMQTNAANTVSCQPHNLKPEREVCCRRRCHASQRLVSCSDHAPDSKTGHRITLQCSSCRPQAAQRPCLPTDLPVPTSCMCLRCCPPPAAVTNLPHRLPTDPRRDARGGHHSSACTWGPLVLAAGGVTPARRGVDGVAQPKHASSHSQSDVRTATSVLTEAGLYGRRPCAALRRGTAAAAAAGEAARSALRPT